MARNRNARTTVTTDDGGTLTISDNGRGGFVISKTRGFKETPEERRERLATGRARGRMIHDSRPRKARTRSGSKRNAIREYL